METLHANLLAVAVYAIASSLPQKVECIKAISISNEFNWMPGFIVATLCDKSLKAFKSRLNVSINWFSWNQQIKFDCARYS